VAGEPVSVLAEQVVGVTGVDMALYGTLRFPDDVVAQIEASFLAPERQVLEVVGEGGVLRAFAPWRVDLGGDLVLERGGASEVVAVEEANSYAAQLENFAAAVGGDGDPLLGRADAVGQARVIDALYRSAAERAAVAL
jgi:predicted dehydrogenase